MGASGYKGTDGLVYVYSRGLTGTWTLSQSLTSVTGPNSQFGYSLAVFNQTIVVGAPGRFDSTSLANNTGSVYSYQFNPATSQWTLNQSIASPAGDNSYFGVSVKLSNFRLAIGADGYRKFFLLFHLKYLILFKQHVEIVLGSAISTVEQLRRMSGIEIFFSLLLLVKTHTLVPV